MLPNHVLGTQDDLKNPSITNIKNYYKTWYVPNNMAICLSGDFNPDEMIATIDKYFGDMKPNPNLPKLTGNADYRAHSTRSARSRCRICDIGMEIPRFGKQRI